MPLTIASPFLSRLALARILATPTHEELACRAKVQTVRDPQELVKYIVLFLPSGKLKTAPKLEQSNMAEITNSRSSFPPYMKCMLAGFQVFNAGQ